MSRLGVDIDGSILCVIMEECVDLILSKQNSLCIIVEAKKLVQYSGTRVY